MKPLKILAILTTGLFFTGCQEPALVEIDSLSAMGDEFFFGQKVKVWMAVKTDDLPAARYQWACDGGRLTQPQGLDENTWEAPRKAGRYNITCEVNVNGKKESRVHEMWVSSYYFEKFEKTSHTFTTNGSSATIKNGHLEPRVNSTTATRGYVQRAFADVELKVPVSSVAQVGWISNFPKDAIRVGTAVAENTLYYEWTLNRDPRRQDNLFIDNVRFEWYPAGKTSGLPVGTDGKPYNGLFRFQQRNATNSVATPFLVTVNHPALTFAQNQNKKVAMTIGPDYRIYVYVGGEEIINSDALIQWRATNKSKDDIFVNQWRINYVGASSGQTTPLIYLDDAYTSNDGTIYK
ncbi:hypothetical protein [Tellurirhabdus bombi]|uniref:hypothetical protein n=1 Tax=Tellurirhabdus bombi TaxID=2907205 RepID=UPI001F2798B2|nr:hypothetical protein [Tellurirhabdus bombi]